MNNKGITLITLVVTIIVMIILAGTSSIVGLDSLEKAEKENLNTELTMVNNVVLEAYTNYIRTKDSSYLIGTKYASTDSYIQTITTKAQINLIQIPDDYEDALKCYYKLSITDLETMGITDSKYTYIVNYATGEVINETKAQEGEQYYMYSKSQFNNTDVTAF